MEVVGIVLPVAVSAALHHARVKRWEARGPLGYKGRGTGAAALAESAQQEARLEVKSSTVLNATVESIRAAPATSSWVTYQQPAITGQRFLAKCNPYVVLQLGEQVKSTPVLNNLEEAASCTSVKAPYMVDQQLDFSLPAANSPLQLQAFLYARKADNSHARLVALAAVSVDALPETGQPLYLEVPLFERHGRQCGSIKLALHVAASDTGLVPPTLSQKMSPGTEEPTSSTVAKIPPPIFVVSGDGEPSIAVPKAAGKGA